MVHSVFLGVLQDLCHQNGGNSHTAKDEVGPGVSPSRVARASSCRIEAAGGADACLVPKMVRTDVPLARLHHGSHSDQRHGSYALTASNSSRAHLQSCRKVL